MPFVEIRYDGHRIDDSVYGLLVELVDGKIPEIVAKALHVEENTNGHLSPDMVEIDLDTHSVVRKNKKDIVIRIEGMNFPERVRNKTERCAQIHEAIRALIPPTISMSTCLMLLEEEYMESDD